MHRAIRWAAFLASMTLVWALVLQPADADGRRPTYACFSPQNAAAIGKLGANDASVRYGFETGACLAFAPGVPVDDVQPRGGLWQFRAMSARPYLYAADWAAGFSNGSRFPPNDFEQYLPVTARLLALGRTLAECEEAWEKMAVRLDEHDRRWKEYQRWGRSRTNGSAPVVVIYVGDTGPKLAAEGERLRSQAAALERRCAPVASIEVDQNFIGFARTARL